MDLLTKEEASSYLQDVLGVPATDIPILSDNCASLSTKLSFLEFIIRRFLEREPFQSIYLMSHDVSSRRRPSWDEIKRDLLLGRGGLCYWLNTFMYALLSSLGFNASMTFSTYNVGTYSPNNHVIVLLHDLESTGSLHLVDVGLGCYIPRVISLDFTKESPEFTDSFMTYKFLRESESEISLYKKVAQTKPALSSGHNEKALEQQKIVHTEREHDADGKNQGNNSHVDQSRDFERNDQVIEANLKQNAVLNGNENSEIFHHLTWQKLYFFNPLIALKDLESFFPCFDIYFGDVTKLTTHSSPRAMCWPNGRFQGLVNSKLVEEKEEGKLTKTGIIDITVRTRPPSANQDRSADSDVAAQKTAGEAAGSSEKIVGENVGETVANGSKNNGDTGGEHTTTQSQCQLKDLDPLILAYKQYFPQLPTEMVQAALKNWLATGTIFPLPEYLA